jgi:Ca-activated chloride channel family protein
MRSWQPTAALGLIAGVTALLAPQWSALASGGGQTPEPVELPTPEPVLEPVLVAQADSGVLHLEAGLDHAALMEGSTQERLLVVTVSADQMEGGERAPINVAVVVDRSGSMRQQDRMGFAHQAAEDLVSALQDDDRFALVSFASNAQLVVPSTPVHNPGALYSAIRSIQPAGSTNLHEGLRMGQLQVRANATPESVDRVILLSDGYANVGVQLPSELSNAAGQYAQDGVAVSTIGLGLDYNEDLLAQMADSGGGSYRFVNDAESLQAAFDDELHRLNSVAARGVGLDIALEDAELIDVIGYDATQTDTGLRIWMGDVYGGETRRVVMRVRMKAGAEGQTLDAATVRLSEGGTQVGEAVAVQATVTDSVDKVERSANRELAVVGNEASAADYAQKAAIAFEDGDIEASNSLINTSALVAGEAASRYGSTRLEEQSGALKRQQDLYDNNDPSSEEGRYAIKSNKEDNRVWTR